jgi:hypothetical protein
MALAERTAINMAASKTFLAITLFFPFQNWIARLLQQVHRNAEAGYLIAFSSSNFELWTVLERSLLLLLN